MNLLQVHLMVGWNFSDLARKKHETGPFQVNQCTCPHVRAQKVSRYVYGYYMQELT